VPGELKDMRAFIIKLAIGIAGLALLVKYGSIDLGVLVKAADRPWLLFAAFLCILASVPIAAWRWWLLLRGLQFSFSIPWAMNTTFISLFFHTFLPGAHGGDLVRLALAYRVSGGGLNRLTFSVIVDRLSGLAALLLLGVVLVPALPDAYAHRLEWIAGIVVAAGVTGLVFALMAGDLLARMFGRLPAPVGPILAKIVSELVQALRAYLTQPGLLVVAFVVSVAQYLLILLALFLLGHAMGFVALSWWGYAIAGVWSTVANALPITPGGIGVGEAAFAHVATALSASSANGLSFGTVFLAMRVLTVLLGVVGVLPWLLHRVDLRRGLAAIRNQPEAERPVPVAE
jgi:uncharacterized protein (TIRG00374 family)